jgi:hypothetical protein
LVNEDYLNYNYLSCYYFWEDEKWNTNWQKRLKTI